MNVVFGPDRPAAAFRAISELTAAATALATLTGWSDYDSPAIRARYKAAHELRAQYYEYGDEAAALHHA